MLKIAALGAIAYAGYRYFQTHSDKSENDNNDNMDGSQSAPVGGPLTANAPVQPAVPNPTGIR